MEVVHAPAVPPLATSYATPPLTHHPDGRERRVGIELEFAGLDTQTVLTAIQQTLGGVVAASSPTRGEVRDTPFGEFHVELDATVLKERAYADALKRIGLDVDKGSTLAKAEELVLRAARELVPMEVASPPVPVSRLGELEGLWARLRDLGAQGTHASWRYAFGLHLNPELTDDSADAIISHLKAFLLLEPWLMQQGQTNATRRMSPYINPFPKEYRALVLSVDYWPALAPLISDYLASNPTRDRPLDLLPLFAHLQPGALEHRIEDAHLIKARPTFHYRLPNSDIDREDWSPAKEWNRWLLVEKLALDRSQLVDLSRRFLESPAHDSLTDPWPGEVQEWVERTAASASKPPASAPTRDLTDTCSDDGATSR